MTNMDSFKLVNHWFNQLVDESEQSQKQQLEKLASTKVLSHEQIKLLTQMLVADSEKNLPESLSDVVDDWLHNDAQQKFDELPTIGPYRLLELIGSGGMGHVYLAARDDGSYQQQVAIKISQFHLNQSLVKRFENERQILAQLSHPNIAQLLDGGTAVNDQPYLVMEHIKGESIDVYCIRHQLGLRQRLELIIQTCEAVSFAHQNLVLHRDLKPANILVNDTGQVKLLDFGIAKLLSDDLNKNQPTTTQIMTRNYASPEQIKGVAVSTQSDLFSLAVIAYELVSGYHPYARNSEIERDQHVVSGKIKRITTRNDDPNAVFPELATIGNNKLKGDLENILNKALSANMLERYVSVEAFAADLKNFMVNRPVSARKPSIWYILRKSIQRQKLLSALVFSLVLTLISASLFSYSRAKFAEKQAELAAIEAQKSQSVAEFLIQLFAKSNPNRNQTEVMAQDILLQGFVDIEADNTLIPAVKYELLTVIYRSLWNLGKYAETKSTIDHHYAGCVSALGEMNEECQSILIGSFDIYSNSNEYDKVLQALDKAEAIELNKAESDIKNLLYIYDTKLLTLLNLNQNELGVAYGKKALALRKKYFNDNPFTVRLSMSNLALTFIHNKEFEAALDLIDQIPKYIAKVEDETKKQSAWGNYYELQAFYFARLHDSVKAAAYRQKAVDHMNQHFEVLSDSTIWTNRVLASEMAKAGDVTGALAQYDLAEALYKNQVSDNEPQLFRIYTERLLLYALEYENVSVEQQWQLLKQLKYDHNKYSTHIKLKATAAAFYYLTQGELMKAQEATEELATVLADTTAADSVFPVYELIAQGRLQLMLQQPKLALKTFNQAFEYWQTYTKFNLHLKAVVAHHITQLSTSQK